MGLHRRPDLPMPYVAPRNGTEQVIAEIWQELLGVAPIGVDDNFLDLGGHSLLAIQLISRIRDALHQEISVQRFFEVPTVAAVAGLVHGDGDLRPEASAGEDSSAGSEPALHPASPPTPLLVRLPREQYRTRRGGDGVVELPEALRSRPAPQGADPA
jgi:acyl carrier protein